METLKVGELKSRFSEVLQRVQAGEEIVISFGKRNKKVAVLIPYARYQGDAPRRLGALQEKGPLVIGDDFAVSDEQILGV